MGNQSGEEDIHRNTSKVFQYSPPPLKHPVSNMAWSPQASCQDSTTSHHLHSTICQGASGETGGSCPGASSPLTWSVQVVLLERVLERPLAEQHRASTYPQVQDPRHRRHHGHPLKKTSDRKGYPRLKSPAQSAPLLQEGRFQTSCSWRLLQLELMISRGHATNWDRKPILGHHKFIFKFHITKLQGSSKYKNKLFQS